VINVFPPESCLGKPEFFSIIFALLRGLISGQIPCFSPELRFGNIKIADFSFNWNIIAKA
jgi:hypothetical protein